MIRKKAKYQKHWHFIIHFRDSKASVQFFCCRINERGGAKETVSRSKRKTAFLSTYLKNNQEHCCVEHVYTPIYILRIFFHPVLSEELTELFFSNCSLRKQTIAAVELTVYLFLNFWYEAKENNHNGKSNKVIFVRKF